MSNKSYLPNKPCAGCGRLAEVVVAELGKGQILFGVMSTSPWQAQPPELPMKHCRHLVFVLGDQLDEESAALADFDSATDITLMAEGRDESTQAWASKPRIAFFFAAMRHFVATLEHRDISVDYLGKDGTTMGWISRFRAFGKIKRTDPWGETAIGDAPYDAHKAVRGNLENPNPAAPGDRPGAQIAGEIKRRQTSIAVRYVAAVRARAR